MGSFAMLLIYVILLTAVNNINVLNSSCKVTEFFSGSNQIWIFRQNLIHIFNVNPHETHSPGSRADRDVDGRTDIQTSLS